MAISDPAQDNKKAPNQEDMMTAYEIDKNYDPFSEEETIERLRKEGYVLTRFMFDPGGREIPFVKPSGTEAVEVEVIKDNPGGLVKRYLVYDPTMVEVREVNPGMNPKADNFFGRSGGWEEIETDSTVVFYIRRK